MTIIDRFRMWIASPEPEVGLPVDLYLGPHTIVVRGMVNGVDIGAHVVVNMADFRTTEGVLTIDLPISVPGWTP